MKTLKIIYLGLLLLTMLFACTNNEAKLTAENEKLSQVISNLTQPLANISPKTLDSLCLRRPMKPNQGRLIDSLTAATKLLAYKTSRQLSGTPYDAQKDAYGFAFGVNAMNDLMSSINSYNKAHPTDSITGLRVYRAMSYVNGDLIPDAFIMPVLKSGHNFVNIDPDFQKSSLFPNEKKFKAGAPGILNTSAPCPNRCE